LLFIEFKWHSRILHILIMHFNYQNHKITTNLIKYHNAILITMVINCASNYLLAIIAKVNITKNILVLTYQ